MDVMAVSSQSCLDLSTELDTQQQIQVRVGGVTRGQV